MATTKQERGSPKSKSDSGARLPMGRPDSATVTKAVGAHKVRNPDGEQ
jgi:hypothetical protein